MKILKYLFFLLLLVFIGGAIYFGTKDGSYEIREKTEIEIHPELVFNKVNDLSSWKDWSPWKKEKTDDIFTTAEKSKGEGASASWDGKEKGNVETLKIIPNSEIEQRLVQKNTSGKRTSKMTWDFEPTEKGTEITWTIRGEHSLTEKIYLALKNINFDKILYSRMQFALQDLKEEIEENTKKYSIHVDGISHYGGGYYMYMTSAGQQSEIQTRMEPMMKEVSDFMEKNNIPASGKPFILYNEIDPETHTVIFSTCFPVRERVITPESGGIVSGFMEPVTAVKTTLKGNYKNMPEAYIQAEEYIENNDYQIDDSRRIFEVYSSDPNEIHNPADWITEIYIPVRSHAQQAESVLNPQKTETDSILNSEE